MYDIVNFLQHGLAAFKFDDNSSLADYLEVIDATTAHFPDVYCAIHFDKERKHVVTSNYSMARECFIFGEVSSGSDCASGTGNGIFPRADSVYQQVFLVVKKKTAVTSAHAGAGLEASTICAHCTHPGEATAVCEYWTRLVLGHFFDFSIGKKTFF